MMSGPGTGEAAAGPRSAGPGPALTVREILARSADFLSSKGVDTARLDAERMIAEVLGIERLDIYLEPERIIGSEERDRLRELVRRRGHREPAQYILGSAGFYGMELATDRRALIPRRETELLVDRARDIAGDRPVRALDVGTGAGGIALALAKHLPHGSSVWATDRTASALDLARENASRLGLERAVTFAEGGLFSALPAESGQFDIVVANLPYVPSEDFGGLMPEVRDHEPRGALDGGTDGLDVIRACVREAPTHLAAGGWLLLEVGSGQASAVEGLVREVGLEPGPILRDAANIERVVQGKKPG